MKIYMVIFAIVCIGFVYAIYLLCNAIADFIVKNTKISKGDE